MSFLALPVSILKYTSSCRKISARLFSYPPPHSQKRKEEIRDREITVEQKRQKKEKKNQTKWFASLEFVYYYLFIFSRDSKQFHFFLFSFVVKQASGNDKKQKCSKWAEEDERLDLMQFRQKSVRCVPGCENDLLSHAGSQ